MGIIWNQEACGIMGKQQQQKTCDISAMCAT